MLVFTFIQYMYKNTITFQRLGISFMLKLKFNAA